MANIRISLHARRELRKLLEAAVANKSSQVFKNLRSWCNDTQKDKSKGDDYKLAWELFWLIPAADRTKWCDLVYRDEGCNDDHISTVLREWVRSNFVRIVSEKEANGLLH